MECGKVHVPDLFRMVKRRKYLPDFFSEVVAIKLRAVKTLVEPPQPPVLETRVMVHPLVAATASQHPHDTQVLAALAVATVLQIDSRNARTSFKVMNIRSGWSPIDR